LCLQRTVDAVFVVDDLLEGVVGLSTDLHGLSECLGTSGEDHELLESELVASVRTTVDDVEAGDREDVRRLDTSELSKVLVERDALLSSSSLGNGDGDTKDGVGTELAFVRGAVKLDQEVVDGLLVGDRNAGLDELGSDGVVDVGNSLRNT
jgi:hypothetical protein